jgi:hypothetical protein
MAVETVYRAEDGSVFDDRSAAVEHERQSMRDWMATNPLIDISAILEEADDQVKDEYYVTHRELVMEVVNRAWARRRNVEPRIDPITEEEY